MGRLRWAGVALLLGLGLGLGPGPGLALGCEVPPEGGPLASGGGTDAPDPGTTGDGGDPTDPSTSGATTDAEPEPDDDDDRPLYDVPLSDVPGSTGCEQIDFLFVIDNSGSMGDEQEELRASFSGFMAAVRDSLETDDYHVMVVDTDEATTGLQVTIQCSPDPACCDDYWETNPLTVCNGVPGVEQLGCDAELGAGVIMPLGPGATNDVCVFAGGHRYITEAEPDLDAAFECAATLGTAGAVARPMDALVAAVDEAQLGPGGCNEGFIRDDALLVVTLITDTATFVDDGDPQQWHDTLAGVKGGNAAAVVVLGLLGDTALPDAVCTDAEAHDAPEIRAFVDLFKHGTWASICAPDYADFFTAAVDPIHTACDDFDPAG